MFNRLKRLWPCLNAFNKRQNHCQGMLLLYVAQECVNPSRQVFPFSRFQVFTHEGTYIDERDGQGEP